MSVIWIGLSPALLFVGDAVILSSLPLGWTRVVLVGHYQPLTLVGHWAPFLSVWPGAWWSRQSLFPGSSFVSRSHWVALLRGWLVSLDVMCFGGHHFLIIYNTVWIHPDLESLGIVQVNLRNPCILHLKAFVLYIAPFLLCYFGRIIFLEYDSGPWSNWHYLIRGSLTVAELFWEYKRAPTASFGDSDGLTSELFPG